MAIRKIKNKEQTFEVSQDELQGYYSRYLPHYGPGGPLPATNPWFKIANLGNKLSNFKNVSNKDIKAKDYMKFSLTNTAKAGDLSGDETEFMMEDDGVTFQLDENNKKITNPLYDSGNRYLSMDKDGNPILLTYGQNKANLLNPYIGADSERVKSGMFTERKVDPVTGRVIYVNKDGSRTSGDVAEDHLVNYNAESFNFNKDNEVVSWNTTKYNDLNQPTEIITNPYDVNNPYNIKKSHSEQEKINEDYIKPPDEIEIDGNENIHPDSQKKINEEYLKNINKDIDDKTKTDVKYGGQLPKAQNSTEVVFENWSDQFEKADLQGELDAAAENYGIANIADIDLKTGMPTTGSLSAYGEVWGTENYAEGSWEDIEGVTPTTEDLDPKGGWANTTIGSIDDEGVMSVNTNAEVPFADRNKYSSIPGQNQNEAGEWVDGEPVLKQYDDDGFQIYNTLDKDQMKTAQKSLKVKNKADKKALKDAEKAQRVKKRKMWGDNFAQQATNFGNYALDKLGNSKGAALADITVDAAGIFTDFKKAQNASIMNQKPIQGMNTVDNLIDPLEANAEGTRGNYDTLTGLLRIDDAVVSELARDGKELYQVGGEPESLTSLQRFTEGIDGEIGYNEEDILNQKLSLALMRQGGSLPKAQFGYVSSGDGKSNLNQSLKLAGTTALASMFGRGAYTGINNRGNYKDAYNDYIDIMGDDWYNTMCTTGTCPSVEANRLALLDGHSEPNFAWFRGTDDNLFGKQNIMNKHNVLQKGDLANAYWQNVKQGVKDGLYTGAINYGLNYLTDNTRIGNRVKNWWEDKGLPNINFGYLSRKYGGDLPKAQSNIETSESDSTFNVDNLITNDFEYAVESTGIKPYIDSNLLKTEYIPYKKYTELIDPKYNPEGIYYPDADKYQGEIKRPEIDKLRKQLMQKNRFTNFLSSFTNEYGEFRREGGGVLPKAQYSVSDNYEEGGEQVDIDEQLLQELIAAGADIEIL